MTESGHDGVVNIPIEAMPFFESMKTVQENTGLSNEDLLSNQVGFRAHPSSCICGHEWNAFDVVIEAVRQSGHEWSFFKSALVGEFGGFFSRRTELTCCRCGVKTSNIDVLYKYATAKTLGWSYPSRG